MVGCNLQMQRKVPQSSLYMYYIWCSGSRLSHTTGPEEQVKGEKIVQFVGTYSVIINSFFHSSRRCHIQMDEMAYIINFE